MPTAEEQSTTHDVDTVERLEQLLDEWRGKIDELLVQVDLASKDVSEEVRDRATAAQNAYLAAKNQLRQIPKDAGSNLGSLRSGVEQAARRPAPGVPVRRGRDPAGPERVGPLGPPGTVPVIPTAPARVATGDRGCTGERHVHTAAGGGARLRGRSRHRSRGRRARWPTWSGCGTPWSATPTRTDPGWALQAVADQLAYDAALIRLARKRGIPIGAGDFDIPERGRTALEDALVAKGVNLPPRAVAEPDHGAPRG